MIPNDGLLKLIEACGSLSAVAARLVENPDSRDRSIGDRNDEVIADKIADLIGSCRFTAEKMDLNAHYIDMRVTERYTTLLRWDQMQ